MKTIRAIIWVAICGILFSGCQGGQAGAGYGYGVFIGVNPDNMEILYEYTTVVIDAAYYTKADIQALHQKGVEVYSYLNIGTIETFREDYASYRHCVLGPYEDWPGEYWVDVSQQAWQSYIAAAARALAEKEVDGFFLDNTDVYYEYHTPEILGGLVAIINGLQQHQKAVVVNGGDVFVTEAVLKPESPLVHISGVNQECVFTNIDFEQDTLVEQEAETSQYYQSYLEQCSAANLTVYLTEYINGNNKALTKTIESYCQKHRFIYFIASSKALEG